MPATDESGGKLDRKAVERARTMRRSSQPLGLMGTLALVAMGVFAAILSGGIAIRIVLSAMTTADWDDPVPADDPTALLMAVIALAGLIYSLLAKIRNEHSMGAAFGSALAIVGIAGTLGWTVGGDSDAVPSGSGTLIAAILTFWVGIAFFAFYSWKSNMDSTSQGE